MRPASPFSASLRATGCSRALPHAALDGVEEVGDVRGRGFFIGVEFVRDRAGKRPFPRERALSFDIGARAFSNGLICYPCAGNVDGRNGDTIILAPPYNATDGELEEIATKLTTAIAGALGELA